MTSYEFVLPVDRRGKITIPEIIRRRLCVGEYADKNPSEVRVLFGPVEEEFR